MYQEYALLQSCAEHALQRGSAGSGAASVEAAMASSTTPTKAACGAQGYCGSEVQQMRDPMEATRKQPLSAACTRLYADASSSAGHYVGTASFVGALQVAGG